MTVAVCIASRGRPNEFARTREQTMDLAELPGTHITVALDAGDVDYPIDGSRAPRENSLGAKYNRAMSYANPDATVFVLGLDDAAVATKGWDRKLMQAASLFADGVGVINSGPKEGLLQLPVATAVTKGWIEKVGFFCPPYFPFWWHDTWIDEMSRFTGRYVWTDIAWDHHGASEQPGTHKTTRMRDVSWWAKFFDATRDMRMAKAREMIMDFDDPAWLKSQLLSEMPAMAQSLWMRNGHVRENGRMFESTFGGERGIDSGYDQIKAQAAAMMTGLKAA